MSHSTSFIKGRMLDGVTAWQFKAAQPGSEYCVQPGSPRLFDRVREANVH